jgi:nucleotide-binding universal stress UspA family protein
MEKILVAIDSRHGAWEALSHACSLAKRIDATLNVLLVVPLKRQKTPGSKKEVEEAIRKRLELSIEAAKAEGIRINYYIAEGKYEEEIINFINHNKTLLLVHEANDRDARSAHRDQIFLRSLRHRIACTVEIVSTKKPNISKNERNT